MARHHGGGPPPGQCVKLRRGVIGGPVAAGIREAAIDASLAELEGAERGQAAPAPPRLSLSLRTHLTAMILAVTLPLLAFAAVEGWDAVTTRRAQAVLQMRLQLSRTVQGVADGLAATAVTAKVLAASPALARGDLAGFRLDAEMVASHGADVVLRDRSGRAARGDPRAARCGAADPAAGGPRGARVRGRRVRLRRLQHRDHASLAGARRGSRRAGRRHAAAGGGRWNWRCRRP